MASQGYFVDGTMILMEKLHGNSFDVFTPLPVDDIKLVLRMLAVLHVSTSQSPPTATAQTPSLPFGAGLIQRRSLRPLIPVFVGGAIGA